jgi:hypothetical protein
MFMNSVLTSKKTPVTITEIDWLILFKEIITVYSENHNVTRKYKMQSYSLVKKMVRIVTIRCWRVKDSNGKADQEAIE